MRRVPVSGRGREEEFAHLQHCGRPAGDSGLCPYHEKQQALDRREEDGVWKRTFQRIGRGHSSKGGWFR